MFILMQNGNLLVASSKKKNLKYFAKEYAYYSNPSEANKNMISKSPEKAWEQKYKEEFSIIEIPFSDNFSYSFIEKLAKGPFFMIEKEKEK